ncbi:MAG: hydroxysqualene dehydroxylase HpnE [Pirellulaceae bacterium]
MSFKAAETSFSARPRLAIIGGGLAGLAAAEALSRFPLEVHLWEARRSLGGRAGSYHDQSVQSWVDRCQHVAMGCCVNFLAFCKQLDLSDAFRRDKTLTFVSHEGKAYAFTANRYLPAPLHLAGAFRRQGYLSRADKRQITQALWQMAKGPVSPEEANWTMLHWLRQQDQGEAVIQRFWNVVLVSALGAPLDQVAYSAARKVFVDGFLRTRGAYEVLVPRVPLQEVFDHRSHAALDARGVQITRGKAITKVETTGSRFRLLANGNEAETFDSVICAAPWHQLPKILGNGVAPHVPFLDQLAEIPTSPISSVHLWLDCPITDLPHAVILDRVSQWIFNHGRQQLGDSQAYYYQVVISASDDLIGRGGEQIVRYVLEELHEIFPDQEQVSLVDWQVVTERKAVFSATPQTEAIRPSQATSLPGFALAGDWTATGWPSTMEGAVRSGYLAAEAILRKYGIDEPILTPDPRPALLSRLFFHFQ